MFCSLALAAQADRAERLPKEPPVFAMSRAAADRGCLVYVDKYSSAIGQRRAVGPGVLRSLPASRHQRRFRAARVVQAPLVAQLRPAAPFRRACTVAAASLPLEHLSTLAWSPTVAGPPPSRCCTQPAR